MDARIRAGVAPRRHVSLHFIGNEGLLFDASAQRIYAINSSAAYVWCRLEEELAPARIAERLNESFGMAKSEAIGFVHDVIARWRELRLVSDPVTAGEPPQREAPKRPAEHPPRKSRPRLHAAAERDIRLLDSDFRIRFFSESLLTLTAPFLAPLARRDRAREPQIIDLLLERENYALYEGFRRVGRAERLDQVVPMLLASLTTLVLERSIDFCALHAAAVAQGGKCVVFAGPVGVGKSTLAAASLSCGYSLLSDDTLVLASDTLSARPLPFALCLKQGASELLSEFHRDLAKQTLHERWDGKRVRYYMPPPDRICSNPAERYRVSALVFPNRRPGAAGALVPLTRSDALSRLSRTLYPAPGRLDAAKVEQLLAWIAPVECYELQFSGLEGAVRLIAGLSR